MVPSPEGCFRPWPVLASPPLQASNAANTLGQDVLELCQRVPTAMAVYSVSALRNAVEPAMPAVSEQSRWVDELPEDSFFALQDVPGPSLGAVRAFLHREASGSDPLRRIVRLAPSLYWKAGETYRIDGQLYLPSRDRIGEAYAGPHAAAAEYHGASRAGWLTQVPVRFTFAVPGEPRSRNPLDGVKLVGRRNPRRRELNTSEATYLEAVATFDRWANADPLDGDPWHDALERASILLGWRVKRGVIVPDPDALLYAAATERPLSRRVFQKRVEELAAMIARVVAKARRI